MVGLVGVSLSSGLSISLSSCFPSVPPLTPSVPQ